MTILQAINEAGRMKAEGDKEGAGALLQKVNDALASGYWAGTAGYDHLWTCKTILLEVLGNES